MPQHWYKYMPLSHPVKPGFREIDWLPQTKVAVSESVFTYAQQVYAWPGKRRKVTVTLPPMNVDTAKAWIGFFYSCNGPENTFFLSPTIDKKSSGNYITEVVSVTSLNLARDQITVSGFRPNVEDIIVAGDWLSIRDKLYSVRENLDSDASGNAVIKVWPQASGAVIANDILEFENPRGIFRLMEFPGNNWSVNRLAEGVTFQAMEDIT